MKSLAAEVNTLGCEP